MSMRRPYQLYDKIFYRGTLCSGELDERKLGLLGALKLALAMLMLILAPKSSIAYHITMIILGVKVSISINPAI